MKRKLTIIRNILLHINDYNDTEITDAEMIYHINLLIESGHMEGRELKDGNASMFVGLKLLNKGHDLLAHVSIDPVWDELKHRAHKQDMDVDDLPIDVAKQLCGNIMVDLFEGD